jgi:hypothetical protein
MFPRFLKNETGKRKNIKIAHILFILALSFVRWSLLVTRKYQSTYSSCGTQFDGLAVPMASTAARCAC